MKPAQQDTLMQKAAALCLFKLRDTEGKLDNMFLHLEFWHTWSNLEVAAVIAELPCLSEQIRSKAWSLVTERWSDFKVDSSNAPAFHKDRSWISNKDFWDKDNVSCLWDDREWLGVAYLELYRTFRVEKYLQASSKLFNFMVQSNSNPLDPNYIGMLWKAGGDYRNSITNQLFFVLVARLYDLTKDPSLTNYLVAQYKFLFKQKDAYINSSFRDIFPDGKPAGGYWTYNQAMSIEALSYMVVFTGEEDYMKELIRLLKGTILFFRANARNICCEKTYTEDKLTSSLFRSYLFRHLYHAKKVLSRVEGRWDQLNEAVPLLYFFVLDNFQAMCKFEDCEPPFDWETGTGEKNYYDCFNHFYVCAAAYELYGLEETNVEGVELKCQDIFKLSYGEKISKVLLTKYVPNSFSGLSTAVQEYELSPGINYTKTILGEDLCVSNNNNPVLGLTVIRADGSKQTNTLVHVEVGGMSRFSLIMDTNPEELANTRVFRVRSKKDWPVTSTSNITGESIVLNTENVSETQANLLIEFI